MMKRRPTRKDDPNRYQWPKKKWGKVRMLYPTWKAAKGDPRKCEPYERAKHGEQE